jgi:NAD(P)-dependent dehydrogenase (short-subunit alcohol dehydrogenase family)
MLTIPKDFGLASFSLAGKVIVITGATGLLGREHAKAVASMGATPVLLDLDSDNVAHHAAELTEEYRVEAAGYKVDITQENEVAQSRDSIVRRFGKIDGLVNNAANNPKMEDSQAASFSRLEQFSLTDWNADLAVGLTGAFLCAKHFGTAISLNSAGGVIVNISSDLGLIAPDQRIYRKDSSLEEQQTVKPVSYSVVKTGLIGLTRYLATYWPDRVRCNALCPGGVEAGQPEAFIKQVTARIPIGRLAKTGEYQGVLVFLLSDCSVYLNGAIIPMDGGRTVW